MNLVNLKTAKALKELGYVELCKDYYLRGVLNGPDEDGFYRAFMLWEDFNSLGEEELVSAPFVDEALCWIDNNYNISFSMEWLDTICQGKETFADAMEEALAELIKCIQDNEISRSGNGQAT